MKKFSFKRASVPSDQNRNALRGGSYSLVVTAIVLAILIAVNVFASALPKSMTNYDISSSKLYSITSNTKVVVNNLQQDVTIYWVVQSGEKEPGCLSHLYPAVHQRERPQQQPDR